MTNFNSFDSYKLSLYQPELRMWIKLGFSMFLCKEKNREATELLFLKQSTP